MSLSIKISKSKIVVTLLFLFISLSFLAQEKFGGLALYTVRDAMTDNPISTLKSVSEVGYSYF
jgi:hypothetical protein